MKAGFARFCNTIYDTQQYFPLVHFRSSHSHYRSVAGHLATIAAFGPHTGQYSGQMCFVLSILIFFCDRLVAISPETIMRWEDLMLDEYRYRTSASSSLPRRMQLTMRVHHGQLCICEIGCVQLPGHRRYCTRMLVHMPSSCILPLWHFGV